MITMSLDKSVAHKNNVEETFQRVSGRDRKTGEALIKIHLIMFACSLTLTTAMSNVDR